SQRRVSPDARLLAGRDACGEAELGDPYADRAPGARLDGALPAPDHGLSPPRREGIPPQRWAAYRGPRRLGRARGDLRIHQLRDGYLGEEANGGGASRVG